MTGRADNYRTIILVIMSCLLISCSKGGEQSFLEDQAGLLGEAQKQYLKDYNNALLHDLDIHFKLIILAEQTADIDEMAAAVFGNLGKKTSGSKGLLFLVDPQGKQARIEVGYDLEGVFPDSFVGYIEEKQMVPFFKVGKVGIGIVAATELFVSRVQRSIAGEQFDPSQEIADQRYFSGGGGAKVSVDIGSGEHDKVSQAGGQYQAQARPEETLKEYMRVLRAHEKNPQLGLFTPETRAFFRKWVVTDGQQDNELRSVEQATPESVVISGDYAVIRFPVEERNQPPYFFRKGAEGWMLDFWTMSNVIRMNHKNYYHFKSFEHPYRFAFSDWKFDNNGFPLISR